MGAAQSSSSSSPSQQQVRQQQQQNDGDEPATATAGAGAEKSVDGAVASSSTDDNSTNTTNIMNPNNLSGYQLIEHVCSKKKKRYTRCVASYYKNSFLQGDVSDTQDDVCGAKFETWRTCVLRGIKHEFYDNPAYGLPKPAENSPLSEVYDDDDDD